VSTPRRIYGSAPGPQVDSPAILFQKRRLLLPLIISLMAMAAVAGYLLADNGVAAIGRLFGGARTAEALPLPKANPDQGLPVEVPLNKDVGLTLYRNAATREKVVDFYRELSGSDAISGIIIKVANRYSVPLSLAFALAWKESKFDPDAVNYNFGSVDRGLYQLNSLSFPDVTPKEFFDPTINAEKGLGYLSHCLKVGGNEVVGLAMYNAGMSRVYRDGTPRVTLDYISTILKYQDAVITEFQHTLLKQADVLKVIHAAPAT
jgi:hypothetical protein